MGRERVLFVTSNGTGLGHLMRSMAIARRLDPELEPLFITLSEAAAVVREVGFPVEYMASHGSPGAGPTGPGRAAWAPASGRRSRRPRRERWSSTASFYDPLVAAIRAVPVTVWCRRGLWRRGASAVR